MEEISEEKAWFDNTIELTTKKCYISVKELYELWVEETKTKRGIKYFTNKIKEYYGDSSIEKKVRKARSKYHFTCLEQDEIEKGVIPKAGKRTTGTIQAVFKKDYLLADDDSDEDSDDEL